MFDRKIIKSVDDVKPCFEKLYGSVSQYQIDRYTNLIEKFKSDYTGECGYMASSSGRVEVVGNHTDHNGGKAVGCAISLDTIAMFLPVSTGKITIKSEGYPDVVVDIFDETPCEKGSSDALVQGICKAFVDKGYNIGGFIASTTSNVSGGAGVSSSAAFELLVCEILNALYNGRSIDAKTKAIISQFAENKYFGKPCGLLDQSAIAFGGITLLDFKKAGTVEVTPIHNDLRDYTLVLIETGGDHKNLTGEYASITDELKEICSYFGVNRLIELNKETFYEKLPELYGKYSGRAIIRAIHFYNEDERSQKTATALENNDICEFLSCVRESGISSWTLLQNCYVPGETKQLIPTCLAIAQKYLNGGVNRVHGGGFAGTVLNVVKNENVEYFVKNMSKIYGEKSVIALKVREVGATVL